MSSFKDHFSTQSSDYSKYRPDYPQELYDFILSELKERKTAWDCGTGNGQAAIILSEYFEKVYATDPSAEQIKNASFKKNIEYRIASAENSTLPDKSIDLITVAQALHWFDFDKFYSEVRRVSKPNALLAIWSYETCQIDAEIDKIVDALVKTGPFAVAETKRLVRAAQEMSPDAGLAAEASAFALCFTREESTEGIEAFISKRSPVFQEK